MNKSAVITGGSSGLGLEIARLLSAQDYSLALIARDKSKLAKAKQQLSQSSIKTHTYSADISKIDQLHPVAEQIQQEFKQIDLLVLNAGTVQTQCLLDYHDFDQLKHNIDIDLWGTILSTRLLLPAVKPGGQLLFVSSGFGLMGTAGYTTYCAAKAGIINFAEALQRELYAKKIKIQVVVPPDMDTPQYHHEIANMPDWLSNSKQRSKPMPVEIAAKKIINKLPSKRFLMVIDNDVRQLVLANKFLPRGFRDWLLNKMFPTPD